MLRARRLCLAAVLASVFAFDAASAGSISLAWDAVDDPGVAGYRVYYGTSAGQYTMQRDVGLATSLTLARLANCTTHFVAVKAVGLDGQVSAGFSNEISGYPRPILSAAAPAVVEQGLRATVEFTAANVMAGAMLRFRDPGITVHSVDVDSCNRIRATITAGSAAAVGPVTIDLTNPDGTTGTSSSVFEIAPAATPFVTGVDPAAAASDVSVAVRPTVTFSEALDAATVNSATATLIDLAGNPVEHAADSPLLSADGKTITIIPASQLAYENGYRIRILGGSPGVSDRNGFPMASDFVQVPGFTTELDPSNSPQIVSVFPAAASVDVPVSVRPTVTFSDLMDGESLSSTTIALLDLDGLERPQAEGSPVLSEDGRTATVVPAAELEYGSGYRIRVLGGAAGVADRSGRFLAKTFVQIPGFVTVATAEFLPFVIDVAPADGIVNVPVTVQPTIRFSEPLLPSSVTTTTVTLLNSAGDAVSQRDGSPVLSEDGTSVTVVPAAPLAYSSSYQVQLPGGSAGVEDLSGGALAEPFTQVLGFKTIADPAGPPRVASVAPASLATGVSREVRPVVTFSEPMDPSTVTASSVILMDANGSAVRQASGSPFVADGGFTATIVPAASLAYSATYRVRVVGGSNGPKDAARNPLASTFTQATGFTTIDDQTAPVISAIRVIPQPTSAVIAWNTDEPATGRIYYRRSDAESDQRPAAHSTLLTNHSLRIEGLRPSTTYMIRVESADSAGQSASSDGGTFTTGASPYNYLTVEAERAQLSSPVRATDGSGAFQGAWIDTPPFTPTGSISAPSGKAAASFFVPSGGTWYVWLRLFGVSAASDSWFESVDGASRRAIAPPLASSWEWIMARSYTWAAGLHVLELGGYEAKAQVDRAIVTNDPAFAATEQPDLDVTPPAAPSGLTASAEGDAVNLAWTNPDSDVAAVEIRYRTDGRYPQSPADGFPVESQSSIPGESVLCSHIGLSSGTTYSYAVFAVDRAGNASAAAQVQITP